VVESNTRKASKVEDIVTRRAIQRCRHMISRLADTEITVVAQRAIVAVYAHVVKRGHSEVRGVMAVGAILVIGIGRYVVNEFTHTDHIVVARRAATNDTGMIIGASGKGAWSMTNTTVFSGWQVVQRFTARVNAMAGIAPDGQDSRIGVVDGERRGETVGGMAIAAIGDGCQVSGHCRPLSECVNTVVVIVA